MRTSAIDRFWELVKPQPTGCWEWQGGCFASGYGQVWLGDRSDRAHRIAYEEAYGSIPPGIFVCHRCDNRRCVNPEHLFLGTLQDNLADRDAKGRQARGERQHSSRLTASDVRAIRDAAQRGVPMAHLARQHGVSAASVQSIVKRKNWRHV